MRFVMKIPDLIELIADDGFRATGRPPFQVTAQGATRNEALARLREAIVRRMMEGSDDRDQHDLELVR
jgi:hypothetical protein